MAGIGYSGGSRGLDAFMSQVQTHRANVQAWQDKAIIPGRLQPNEGAMDLPEYHTMVASGVALANLRANLSPAQLKMAHTQLESMFGPETARYSGIKPPKPAPTGGSVIPARPR